MASSPGIEAPSGPTAMGDVLPADAMSTGDGEAEAEALAVALGDAEGADCPEPDAVGWVLGFELGCPVSGTVLGVAVDGGVPVPSTAGT